MNKGRRSAPCSRKCGALSRAAVRRRPARSEEHTSELQSPCNLVCRLLLEKKKNHQHTHAAAPGSDTSSNPPLIRELLPPTLSVCITPALHFAPLHSPFRRSRLYAHTPTAI